MSITAIGLTFMTAAVFFLSMYIAYIKTASYRSYKREEEIRIIYEATCGFANAGGIHDIVDAMVAALNDRFSSSITYLCFDKDNVPLNIQREMKRIVQTKVWHDTYDMSEREKRFNNMFPGLDVGDEFYYWPIPGPGDFMGVCQIQKEEMVLLNRQLLFTIVINAYLAADRFSMSQQRSQVQEEIIVERHRTSLLRSISHDIRTPLSRISCAAEMLLDGTDDCYSLASVIQKDSRWLILMVENILCLTRLEDGKLNIEKYPEVVEEVLGDVIVNHMSKQAPNREISVYLTERPLIIPMDAIAIKQVLINLLDNAIRHTLEDDIAVIVEEAVDEIIFTIRDGGIGIPEQNLPHIFNHFFTYYKDGTKHRVGIGLGLPICEAIVNAHGGKIWARNRTDCAGAELVFTLPKEEVDFCL